MFVSSFPFCVVYFSHFGSITWLLPLPCNEPMRDWAELDRTEVAPLMYYIFMLLFEAAPLCSEQCTEYRKINKKYTLVSPKDFVNRPVYYSCPVVSV